jgi:hypothetical protein
VHVLGHDDVSDDNELVTLAHTFECGFEQVSCGCGSEIWQAVVAAEGEEVEISGLVETTETLGHRGAGYGIESTGSVVGVTSLPGLKSETWGLG